MKQKIIFTFMITTGFGLSGMQSTSNVTDMLQNVCCVVVPGQYNCGVENAHKIFPTIEKDKIYETKDPYWFTDFGQTRCNSYLNDALNDKISNKNNKNFRGWHS